MTIIQNRQGIIYGFIFYPNINTNYNDLNKLDLNFVVKSTYRTTVSQYPEEEWIEYTTYQIIKTGSAI